MQKGGRRIASKVDVGCKSVSSIDVLRLRTAQVATRQVAFSNANMVLDRQLIMVIDVMYLALQLGLGLTSVPMSPEDRLKPSKTGPCRC